MKLDRRKRTLTKKIIRERRNNGTIINFLEGAVMVAAGNNGKNDEDILEKDRRSVYGVKPAFESN